jgi:hypothetical protein
MVTEEKLLLVFFFLTLRFAFACRFEWPRVLTAFPALAQSTDKF